MSGWDELVAGALLGTERRPPAPPSAAGPGEALLAALPWGERPEAALLAAAGVLGTARRAGARPLLVEQEPVPAPPEAAPVCSPRAIALLRSCLRIQQPDLVLLWLERCAAAGRRIPPHRLPGLLDRAGSQRVLRPALLRAGGARLAWLAPQEPRWSWAAAACPPAARPGGPDAEDTAAADAGAADAGAEDTAAADAGAADAGAEDAGAEDAGAEDTAAEHTGAGSARRAAADAAALAAWSTATAEERSVVLRAARQGPDPAAGRALVQSTWEQDPPDERARWVKALADGLSDADEPFLEQALDDRRKPVREAAQELLDHLPRSRRARRMAARLTQLLDAGDRRIALRLPEPPDKQGVRDGLAAKGPDGVRAANLHRIVVAAPLTTWIETTGRDPDAVLARLGGDTRETTYRALLRAAELQQDAGWALALAEAADPRALSREPSGVALLALLDADDRRELATKLLKAMEPKPALALAAEALPGPWDADLSARVVDLAAQAAAQGWWNDAHALTAIATRAHPLVRRRIARHRDRALKPQPLVTLLALMDLRADLEAAFDPASLGA